ncbi:hypothetical protein C5167_018030 [Papaver somniferum]|uniref:Uncharacterized protein n=1 Tax=Papaver somniferum TaxID=3469 RepID=A0A4Y7IL33_PAPSO|nr:hypothetical protein C5167_018030 [Papaver somniferum]
MENLVKTLTSKTISFFKSKNSHLFHRESKTTETPVNHTQSLIEVMKMMSVPEAGPKQKNSLLHQDDSFQSTKLRSLVHHFTSVRVMSKLRRRTEKKREGDEIEFRYPVPPLEMTAQAPLPPHNGYAPLQVLTQRCRGNCAQMGRL